MTLVSVIIPNYNHAPYLEARIESVLNQTFSDFEVILLDDCSTDDSRLIIEKYKSHPKVSQVIYNEVNSGTTFKQWQKGVKLSEGEYIWIAESDDVTEPSFLDKLVTAIISNNAVIAFSQSKLIDSEGKILRESPEILEGSDVMNGKSFVAEYQLYFNSIYNASMVLFRKDTIKDSIWNDLHTFKFCGDWLFWAQIALEGTVVEIKETLNSFRVHGLNVSSKAEKNGLSLLEGFQISQQLSRILEVKSNDFTRKWSEIWLIYRKQYNFSKGVDFKIFRMFLQKCPAVLYSLFQQKIV